MRATENRKVKPWKYSFFKMRCSSNLADELDLVLKKPQLITYLNTILDHHEGLFLDTITYRDYMRVEIKYGLTTSSLNSIKVYFVKPAPVTSPFESLIVTPNSIDDIAESFLPKKFLPSSSEFINALNNSLKRPYKRIDDLRQKRLF